MEVFREDENKMPLYSQWDMGAKYKIYVKDGIVWKFYNCFQTIGEANTYYNKIAGGNYEN